MAKFQMTTTAGAAGLVASATKFFSLFGDDKISVLWEALKDLPIQGAGMSLGGIIVSIIGMLYDESKKNEDPEKKNKINP